MTGLENKYFVLKPRGNDEHARASRMAMREYAKHIADINEQLANDLMEWAKREHLNTFEDKKE